MYCQNCGIMNTDNSQFCSSCGTALNKAQNIQAQNQPGNIPEMDTQNNYVQGNYAQNAYPQNNYAQNPNMYNQIMTKEEFSARFLSKNSNSWIKALWIICFISAVLSLASLGLGNFLAIIDIIFYFVFGILIKKNPNWKLALVVTCYSGFGSIVALVLSGTPSGIVALITGINSVKVLKKLDDAYKNYTTTGILPTEML